MTMMVTIIIRLTMAMLIINIVIIVMKKVRARGLVITRE